MTECRDPDRTWYVHREVCGAEMARAYAEFAYEQLHKEAPYHDGSFQSWAKEQSLSHPYHFRTGVHVWADGHDTDPDDEFLTDPKSQPPSYRGNPTL